MKRPRPHTPRPPIYRDSGFPFQSVAEVREAFKAEAAFPQSADHYIYTRWANPTVIAAEEAVAALEGSAWAMLASSGMSAIDIALSIFQHGPQTGTLLVLSELYGGTNIYFSEVLEKRRGVRVERFQPTQERYDLDELAYALDQTAPEVLYFELVSNPLLIVADGEAVIRLAKERGCRVIVDNTFATPALCKPLELGADLVIHSATKYFSGHGDLTAGAICGDDPTLRSEAMTYRKLVGHILSPDDAYRLTSQLTTFDLRFARQCQNAYQLACLLADHPAVTSVRYPGLPNHPTHAEAMRLFADRGWGAMITFELAGGLPAFEAFAAAVADTIAHVLTLGDAETILLHVPTVFGAERFPLDGMLRLSVGIEPYEQLESAVLAGLKAAQTGI